MLPPWLPSTVFGTDAVPLEELINEPLACIVVRFEAGRIEPLSFRWKTREFTVKRVLSSRYDRTAKPNRTIISVAGATGEVMELFRREGEAVWILSRLQTD
jgi:hypothetical protein